MRKNKTLFIVVLLIISMVNGGDNVLKPMDNFDFALGVYSLKYFQPSRYGRYSYQGTPGENCISLLKPRAFEGTKHFTRFENN